jgi:hypothetical protein
MKTILYFFLCFSLISGPAQDRVSRIREVKSKIDLPDLPPPNSLVLYFKSIGQKDLIFYDAEGWEVHFQYRKDRFDLDARDKVSSLLSGGIYEIRGEWLGLLSFRDEFGKITKTRRFIIQKEGLPTEWCKDSSSILYYKLTGWERLDTLDILY